MLTMKSPEARQLKELSYQFCKRTQENFLRYQVDTRQKVLLIESPDKKRLKEPNSQVYPHISLMHIRSMS